MILQAFNHAPQGVGICTILTQSVPLLLLVLIDGIRTALQYSRSVPFPIQTCYNWFTDRTNTCLAVIHGGHQRGNGRCSWCMHHLSVPTVLVVLPDA